MQDYRQEQQRRLIAIDTRREILEDCAEGNHRMNRRTGYCLYCGAEDETFDPDRKREFDKEEGGHDA